jgi:hypothetical protein
VKGSVVSFILVKTMNEGLQAFTWNLYSTRTRVREFFVREQ